VKAPIDSELLDQLEEDLYEFLLGYGASIDTDNEKVRRCVEKLALISLKTAIEDYVDPEDDDPLVDFHSDMDWLGEESNEE
jgi:hypothetical protein